MQCVGLMREGRKRAINFVSYLQTAYKLKEKILTPARPVPHPHVRPQHPATRIRNEKKQTENALSEII